MSFCKASFVNLVAIVSVGWLIAKEASRKRMFQRLRRAAAGWCRGWNGRCGGGGGL